MADDALQQVLRLVAEGRLTAAEAAPILEALEGRDSPADAPPPTHGEARPHDEPDRRAPRYARIEVTERGRRAVDLRIPLSLGRRALGTIPGLSAVQVAELDDAFARGVLGPVVDISDDDGDGVRIGLE